MLFEGGRQMSGRRKVVAICGPTASGKSDIAILLAERFDGEIVSCDSMQVYRTMDIGTAKPSPADTARVPHHMIDVIDPDVPFSCAEYASAAEEAVDGILSRGRLPVICGGTGLYLEALLFEHPFDACPGRSGLRDELLEFAEENGAHALWERLRAVDPESAAAIHENNVRRVVRAIEIYETTGVPKSRSDLWAGKPRYDSLVIYLQTSDRNKREERIRTRASEMFERGLPVETRRLLDAGIFEKNRTAAGAIGYKETVGYVTGELTRAEALERLVTATRKYAKRQDTWFGHRPYVTPVRADGPDGPLDECCRLISGFLSEK
ncbi:MAG: tRNA (adenosine(37)-N6)-dimethylallyltransferase MiaA [Clostridia bacterium]|nr:tRNA (adenosine(37)-N6)-dimethylallyltransferase MiaA [Clostridia bacterium]